VVKPEEAFVLDLLHRRGDKISLVEARQYGSGPGNLLVVVDLDQTAIATEIGRVSARAEFTVEFLDRAAWLAMLRPAATGLLRFTHEPACSTALQQFHKKQRLPRCSIRERTSDAPGRTLTPDGKGLGSRRLS